MKRSIYILSLLLTGLVILFFACTKEEPTTQKQNTHTNISPTDMHINNLIKNFKQKVAYHTQNPDLKSGETIPADSALWYLEASINYSHAFPNEYYNEMQTDEISISVPVNNLGSVDLTVLTQKYNEMKSEVTAIYNNSNFENKALVLVDLINASRTEDELNITAQTVTGSKGVDPPPPPPVNGPFTEDDDWWYGENNGYCDDPSVWDDASDQLYNATKDLIPDPSGNYFFINKITFTIEGGNPELRRDNDVLDNYLDYYLYAAVEGDPQIPFITNETLCVNHGEMNNYYVFIKKLMFDILPNVYIPSHYGDPTRSIEAFHSLEDDKFDINVGEDELTFYIHKGEFTYGEKIGYSEGDGPTAF
jgi:hypothetical protein